MNKLKAVWLHPPLYPVNVDFFEHLGSLCSLTVFVFGEKPKDHPDWELSKLYDSKKQSFDVHLLGKGFYPRWQIYLPLFLSVLKEERADVVLSVAFAPYGFYAAWFKKILGYRFVLFTDANRISDGWVKGLRRFSRSHLLKRCDAVVSCSPLTTNYLQSLYPQVNVFLSWHTVDVQRWQSILSQLPSKKKLRKKHAIPEDTQLLLGVGRLTRAKKWDKGFQLVKSEQKVHYMVIGDGQERENLLQLAEKEQIKDRFILKRKMDFEELIEYYALADIFFFPTAGEPFGFVVVEAMACGLPILCSDQCGASSLVELSHSGVIFDSDTQLVEAFRQCWQQRQKFSKSALQTANSMTLEKRVQELFFTLNGAGEKN